MMQLLKNKNILITGLISERSIAYGVAQQCFSHGANLIFTYQNSKHHERIVKLTTDFKPLALIKCDVELDEDLVNLTAEVAKITDTLDGVLHSIAYSPKNGLGGNLVDLVDRETFRMSNDISAYSFLALARSLKQFLLNSTNPSLLTLTYYGAEKVIHNYNMMGIAKATLETTMRYMAAALGEEHIRVNSISAGPIKTLAASGIAGFSKILDNVAKNAPLRRNVTITEVGDSAVFLFSELSRAITGENIHVDCGYNIMAAGLSHE